MNEQPSSPGRNALKTGRQPCPEWPTTIERHLGGCVWRRFCVGPMCVCMCVCVRLFIMCLCLVGCLCGAVKASIAEMMDCLWKEDEFKNTKEEEIRNRTRRR